MKKILLFLITCIQIVVVGNAAEKKDHMTLHFFRWIENSRPTYDFIICNNKKFIWFSVPKVGCTSILEIMRENFKGIPHTRDPNYWNYKKHEDYFRFAFVRNPWDRIVSVYTNKVLGKCHGYYKECYNHDFEYFVDFIDRHPDLFYSDKHIRPQLLLFPYEQMDFIGRFENFTEDLNSILKKLDINDVVIPIKNKSKRSHYTEYYNERTISIIARRYAEEIELFNYVYGEN